MSRSGGLSLAVAMFAGALVPEPARAAGFLFYETGSAEVGLASAGYTARAGGPSTLLSNPAGMTRLEGSQVQLGTQLAYGHLQFAHDAQTDPILGNNDRWPARLGQLREHVHPVLLLRLHLARLTASAEGHYNSGRCLWS